MQTVRKLFVPMVAAVAVLTLITIVLAPGVEAEVGAPTLSRPGRADSLEAPALKSKAIPIVLGGSDYLVSSEYGNLPQIAGNNTFIAVVYELNNHVYLRSANSNGFGYEVPLDAANLGNEPKVAFKQGVNVVHIVWAGSTGRFIRHKSCTLSDPLPTCSPLHIVAEDTTAPFSLGSPDVTVDKFNEIHVVWQNSDSNLLFSARSTATNDGASWTGETSIVGLGAPNFDAAPALTSAGDFLHVAFVDKSGSNWLLSYRRSPITGAYNWTQSTNFSSQNTANYGEIFNPTIAAVGAKVFVAWDAKKNSALDKFGLLGALNSNSGASANWPAIASHITSTLAATTVDPNDERFSQEDDVAPTVENTLRPSIGVSGSDFVMVWDQKGPDIECRVGQPPDLNASPEIYYAASQGNNWSGQVGILANSPLDAHVDPDIVINSAGTHVVFMKTLDPDFVNCIEGSTKASNYAVGYRGPWGKDNLNRVRLPIIDR